MMSEASNPPSRRRWFRPRYSLRMLFVVMTVVCVVAGYWLRGAVRKQRAIDQFEGRYCIVVYRDASGRTSKQPTIPRYLRPLSPLIGEEAFGDVVGVQISYTPTTNHALRYLADLPTVEQLWLDRSNITDEGLPYLQACPKLRTLTLGSLRISDRGLIEI